MSNSKYSPFGTVAPGNLIDAQTYSHNNTSSVTRGTPQPKRFNDAFWGFLFFAHLCAMAVVTSVYVPQFYNSYDFNLNNERQLMEIENGKIASGITFVMDGIHSALSIVTNSFQGNYDDHHRVLQEDGYYGTGNPLLLVGCTCVIGFLLSIVSLTFIMNFAEGLIKTGVIFNIITSILMVVAGIMAGSVETSLMGGLFFIMCSCYAYAIWNRIPFAAANLETASIAVKDNIGVLAFAYMSIVVSFGWLLWWTVTAASTLYVTCNPDDQMQCQNSVNGFYVFLLLLSMFWTSQVIKNVVHVTVAGTVGTWWWVPIEAKSCCSKAVRESYMRSMTHSFGSICLGSLLVAIVETIKEMVHQARESGDNMIVCIADCLLGCIESLIEYFNQWAFVYVGLYGYTFVDAAKNVINLFKNRGWTTIIADSLASTVLSLITLGVGLFTGIFAVFLDYVFGLNFGGYAFALGLIVGVVLTQVLMECVGSAVNTIIVCYAEDPGVFEENYPTLSARMREAWYKAYPSNFNY